MKTLPSTPSPLQARLLKLVKRNLVAGNGHAEFSYAQLCEKLSVGNSSLQYMIKQLERKQLLRVERGVSHQKSRFYPIAPPT